jgi:uncharacterized membrane protein YkgB
MTTRESVVSNVGASNLTAVGTGARLERVGHHIVRYGLALVLMWIGAMKFTTYEATGIQPLVANSPVMGWLYEIFSVQALSALLGVTEITGAAMIALRPVSAVAAAAGSALAAGMFLVTLSFLLSTPGWEPTAGGFPALSVVPGQFLLKDVVLLGAAVWSLGEALGHASQRGVSGIELPSADPAAEPCRSAARGCCARATSLRYPKEDNVGTPSVPPGDAPNLQQIAEGHPPDWPPPRPKDAYNMRKAFIGVLGAAAVLSASSSIAQTARDIRGPAAVVPLATEPPPRIVVDAPLAEWLVQGRVVIQYRTENLRIVPVFGPNALDVSPRIGHIHVTVDDGPWRWADASGEPLIINCLPPGPHKVLIELVNANHQPLEKGVVAFVVPDVTPPNCNR